MASHRRPKQPGRTRTTVLTATAAAAVALTTAQAAQADPKASKEEVEEKVDKLYGEAEAATEKYNGAKDKQKKLQKQVADLQDGVARGQGDLNDMRDALGSMASAQYRGGGIDPSVQLFLSADPDSYLEKASALDQMSAKQAGEVKKITAKQRELSQQREEAKDKLNDLDETRKELGEKKKKIQAKLNKAQSLLNELTAEERQELAKKQADEDEKSAGLAGGGGGASASSRAGAAFNAAKAKIGSPYVWGATGPSSFDCSGLTSWAYNQAGVSIPRTSEAQANAGTRLGQDALKPGDLVFFYSDLHHVGFYAGNGQILHAPKPGANVRYESINNMPFQFGSRIG